MAFSIIEYVGDGVTNQYTVNFPLGYLNQSDVTCRVNNEVDGFGSPVFRALTWINANFVQIGGTVPALGNPIVFTRTVSKTSLKHDYTDGAPIIESNLDESNKQAIMAAHEALDGRFGALGQDVDAGNHTIKNLRTPVAANEASTKGYIDGIIITSGNVPSPAGADVGKVLSATGTGVYGWQAPGAVPDATESVKGIAEIADDTDNRSTTTHTVIMTPKQIAKRDKKGTDIASAATLVRPAEANLGGLHFITGSVTVTSFWNEQWLRFWVFQAQAAITLTHSAGLDLGGQDLVLKAGDRFCMYSLGSTNWMLIWTSRKVTKKMSRTIFTAGGTWNKPVGLLYAKVTVQGAGGGAGGAAATTAGQGSGGAGGGAGGMSIKWIDESALGSTETVTVGAGGTGTSGGTGNAGGNSSFGAHCSGAGGGGGSASAANTSSSPAGTGGSGGAGSGGDINITGSNGIAGFKNASGVGLTGMGASSFFGPGAGGISAGASQAATAAPANSGAGGGAPINIDSSGARTGGSGGSGIVIVEEYFE